MIGVTGCASAEAGFFTILSKVHRTYLSIENIYCSYRRTKELLERCFTPGKVKSAPSTDWNCDKLEEIISAYHCKLKERSDSSSYRERDYKVVPQTQDSILTNLRISEGVRRNLKKIMDSLQSEEENTAPRYWEERNTAIAKILDYCICIALYETLADAAEKRNFEPMSRQFMLTDKDKRAMSKIKVGNGKHLFSVKDEELYDYLSVLTNKQLLHLQNQLKDSPILKCLRNELTLQLIQTQMLDNTQLAENMIAFHSDIY